MSTYFVHTLPKYISDIYVDVVYIVSVKTYEKSRFLSLVTYLLQINARCRLFIDGLNCNIRTYDLLTTVTTKISSKSNYIPLRYNDITIYFHIGGRPTCWIWDGVIILHPITDFNGLNIELNFHYDWFCSFWNIVFQLDVVWPRRITWSAGGQHNYCSDFSSRVFGTFQSWTGKVVRMGRRAAKGIIIHNF